MVFLLFAVMDGSLPKSLKHVISNAEYYGPSLFLLGKSEHGVFFPVKRFVVSHILNSR